MDVAVRSLACTGVCLQRKGAHPAVFDYHFENVQLELLELLVAVRRLAERDDACVLRNRNL